MLKYLYFKEPATAAFSSMIFLHDYIMCICLFILGIVVWFTFVVIYRYGVRVPRNLPYDDLRMRLKLRPYGHNRHKLLEIMWTLIPTLVLGAIALPSFAVLYTIEMPRNYDVIVKVTGHQWYWSYTIVMDWGVVGTDLMVYKFDSYMKSEEDLKFGELRLLEVDNPLILPVSTGIKFLVTGDDVIHSFSVTEMGMKMDAIPGRANRVWGCLERTGVFRGQCSELCGVNHGFMPIVVYAVPFDLFDKWFCSKVIQ